MVDCQLFYESMLHEGVTFFTGVPDSLLKSFCAFLAGHASLKSHVTAANEGGAVALAAGHYLATGKPALVYMQNSGLGNAVNPLVSLADPAIYGIPMLLLVGWRGEPGVKDEPQHLKQGTITPSLCEVLGLPYAILPGETEAAIRTLKDMIQLSMKENRPTALIVRANSFSEVCAERIPSPYSLGREAVVSFITTLLPPDAAIVSTTGHISRELFEHRVRKGEGHTRDFLTVGSMGHASQLALGIALADPQRPIVCLDGDGATLMHMGGMAIAGTSGARNLLHVVLNNGSHDSVGGQATVGFRVNLVQIATACGYRSACLAEGLESVQSSLEQISFSDGPHFMEVRVAKGARKDLGRPTTKPADNKQAFMDFLGTR